MVAKWRESAVWPVGTGCYLWAARNSIHSKTLYIFEEDVSLANTET